MTAEQLLQYPGCESYTFEEAQEIIRSLTQFAQIAYEAYCQANQPDILPRLPGTPARS